MNEWVGGADTALGGYRGGGTLSAGGGDCMQPCGELVKVLKDKKNKVIIILSLELHYISHTNV